MTCRLIAATLGFGVLLGCQNRPQQLDPFLGKTTVTPPPTGAVNSTLPPGVSSYPAAPPTMTSQPGVVAPPGSAPATPAPGTFTPNSSTPIPRPLSGTTSPPPNNPPPTSSTPAMNVSGPIRVMPPDPNRRTVVGSPSAPSGGVDIMDLPVRGGGGTQPKTAIGAGNGSLQSYAATPGSNFNVDNAAAKNMTIAGQDYAYGANPTYTRLSGRLEYSPVDGRWLLRYVGPDGRPDAYGGAAVLISQNSMNGFRNGDFVTADGRMEASGSSSPVFTASSVVPQRDYR